MRRLSHLLRLLGAHGVAVRRRPPGAQVLLLLLEEPLVERLLEQSLRRWGSALRGLWPLGGLLRTPPPTRTCVTALQA